MLKKVLFFIPLLIIIPLIIVLSVIDAPLLVFPNNGYKQRISTYVDNEMGGVSSIIDFKILGEQIIFTYTLEESSLTSFAGICIDVSFLDISLYDIMELQLTCTKPVNLQINLMTFLEGESRLSELDTLANYNKEIDKAGIKDGRIAPMLLPDYSNPEVRKRQLTTTYLGTMR